MNMKNIVILLIALGIPVMGYSQNEYEIKKSIENSLNNFFSLLSFINDDEEPIHPNTIASAFKGEHYFRLNGKETDFEAFLSNYSKSVLKNIYVNHTLKLNDRSIKKLSDDPSDRRWKVSGMLLRENATEEDYLITDENISFVVRFNEIDRDVNILEINFSTPLNIVRPQNRREYKFELDSKNSKLIVPSVGGEWRIALVSKYRDVKYYPGISGREDVGQYYPAPFTFEAPYYLKVTANEASPFLRGELKGNSSRESRNYTITFHQNKSTLSLPIQITQKGKDRNIFFDFDDSYSYFQFDVLYSLIYDLGLSGLYTFCDSRFSLGLLFETNFDSFRALNLDFQASESLNTSISTGGQTSDITNGYKKTSHTDDPSSTSYSSLMDPFNEAIHYTKKSVILLQSGIAINQWMSFNIGIGGARARGLHFMKTAYARTVYSYEKQNASLPDIPSEVVYTNRYKDYYYKDPEKWGFAVRPALNFHIPLNDDLDLSLGAGYIFVNGLKDANSLDFSLGFRKSY